MAAGELNRAYYDIDARAMNVQLELLNEYSHSMSHCMKITEKLNGKLSESPQKTLPPLLRTTVMRLGISTPDGNMSESTS